MVRRTQEGDGRGTVKISEMTKEEKKAYKKQIKEENREKRKNKLPKHLKKKACNKRLVHKVETMMLLNEIDNMS